VTITTTSSSSTVVLVFDTAGADGACAIVDDRKETSAALLCGGRVVSDKIPGSSIGMWTDLGGGAIRLCLAAKSLLDEPLCGVCTAATEHNVTVGERDASSADVTTGFDAGFDAGLSFDGLPGID
jgi:hypothetical protein